MALVPDRWTAGRHPLQKQGNCPDDLLLVGSASDKFCCISFITKQPPYYKAPAACRVAVCKQLESLALYGLGSSSWEALEAVLIPRMNCILEHKEPTLSV